MSKSTKKTQKKAASKKQAMTKVQAEQRRKAFIDEYLISLNATAAYLKTHPGSSYNAARSSAAALLANPNIKAEIEARFKARQMGAEEVVARLADMARGSLDPFVVIDEEGFASFDFSGEESRSHLHLIKRLRTKRSRRYVGRGGAQEAWEDESVEVELHDSQAALEKIAKILRLYEDPEAEKFTAPQVVEIIRTYEKERGEEE